MKDKKGEKQVGKQIGKQVGNKRQLDFFVKRQQNFVLNKKRFAQAPLRWF